jgi:dTDP-4-amino-4,6-dideoxygalactose transaminase
MNVPPLDLVSLHEPLLDAMRDAFVDIAQSGRFVLGETVDTFEKQLADYCGSAHAVGMSSGTDALLAALMALDIGPGDEVITSPFTFFATGGSIARVGATPVFVDVEPAGFNIDPAAIEAAMTANTRAIMPVHLYGQMAEMDAIMAIANKHNLHVIEDAAQAIGATYKGRGAGTVGDVGALSFYPTKNLSALGDAGACVTGDAALNDMLRTMRLHGEVTRYHHQYVGGNFRIDAIQAAMLSIKLPHLEAWTDQRRTVAAHYNERLAGLPLVTPAELPDRRHVYHQYTIRVPDGRRDQLAQHLGKHGIGHGVFYPVPLHLQQCFADLGGKEGDLPVAEQAAREALSLPIYPGLTEQQQDTVAHAIGAFFN